MSDTSTGNDDAATLKRRIADLEAELAEARAALRALEFCAEESLLAAKPSLDDAGRNRGVSAGSSSAEKIALFSERFAGRDDAYALRWTSQHTGRSGWAPAVRGGFYTDAATSAELLPLHDSVIERHLRGEQRGNREFHVGLYPMGDDERCRLLACDFDDADWRLDAAAYAEACRSVDIDVLAEISRSGEGAHVWMFFTAPVAAADARAAGAALLRKAMARRPVWTSAATTGSSQRRTRCLRVLRGVPGWAISSRSHCRGTVGGGERRCSRTLRAGFRMKTSSPHLPRPPR